MAPNKHSQLSIIPPTFTMEPIVHAVFEPQTSTWQYVVADPSTNVAVIIDPVLDFDQARNTVSTQSADALLALVEEKGYLVDRLLETHVHADHLTAAKYLQDRLAKKGQRPEVSIGKRIGGVQERFAERYGIAREEYGSAFDKLFDDDEVFHVGGLESKAVHLPGHTPDHMGYLIGNNIFSGDSIFNSDVGSARCDFPGGNAKDLSVSFVPNTVLPPLPNILQPTASRQPPNSSPSPRTSRSTPATTTRPRRRAPRPRPTPPSPSRWRTTST